MTAYCVTHDTFHSERKGKKEREREGDRQSEKERSESLINYNEAFFKILNVSDSQTN